MAKQSAQPPSSRRVSRAGKNSKPTERMQISLRQRLRTRSAFIYASFFIGGLLIVFAAITFYYKIYADPQRVFWDMVANNLQTRGVTGEVVRKSGQATSAQIQQVTFGPTVQVHALKQVNNSPQNQITLESLGTPSADYQHYSLIKQPSINGKQVNYSRVYNMWLKDGGGNQPPQIINSYLTSQVALFGNLPSYQQAQLLDKLHQTYHVDFVNVSKNRASGRRTYTYSTTVNIKNYIDALHEYAVDLGLPVASQITSSGFSSAQITKVNMTVDVLSRQLVKIEDPKQSLKETYSGYGISALVTPPAKTVDGATFQKTINSLQQR